MLEGEAYQPKGALCFLSVMYFLESFQIERHLEPDIHKITLNVSAILRLNTVITYMSVKFLFIVRREAVQVFTWKNKRKTIKYITMIGLTIQKKKLQIQGLPICKR
jgi:hypothetical protein